MSKFRWVYLAHLGYNMWGDPAVDKNGLRGQPTTMPQTIASYKLRFDEDAWHKITDDLKAAGANTIVLDLGEGVKYDSHPELAVEGSWSKQKLYDELSRLRGMGFEVIPKLNFSACHDYWLGEWAYMLSTKGYYKTVCDLIAEVSELFSHPELFHIGMDEETYSHQQNYNYCVIRQGDQWWYDFEIICNAVERAGARPWIWSDYVWHHPEEFYARMSKEVVQSNWYYGNFNPDDRYQGYYNELADRGFDQIPTGSNWSVAGNLQKTAEYIKALPQDNILGIQQTVWYPTLNDKLDRHGGAIKDLAEAKKIFES